MLMNFFKSLLGRLTNKAFREQRALARVQKILLGKLKEERDEARKSVQLLEQEVAYTEAILEICSREEFARREQCEQLRAALKTAEETITCNEVLAEVIKEERDAEAVALKAEIEDLKAAAKCPF